jgi:FkbM family methyltransferase
MRHVYPEPDEIVLDIGGYKGDTAIYFAHHIGKNGRVYSFEPVAANYSVLVENVEANGLSDVVFPVSKACSNITGVSKAISGKSGSPWAFLSEAAEGETIDTITVDEFVCSNRLEKVDFIKIDAEGSEGNVLAGAMETIKRFKPKLAVCLYHKTGDLIDIPEFIRETGLYDSYVRCKMEGPFAVNLFCKDRNR